MQPFGQDAERIDDRRDEETGLRHDLPDLVQVAIAQEQHARRERETSHDGEEHAPGTARTARRAAGDGARPVSARNAISTTENSASVITAFEVDVTTTIQDGNRALVSRYPWPAATAARSSCLLEELVEEQAR